MSFTSVICWLFPKNHRYFILRGNEEIILSSSLLLVGKEGIAILLLGRNHFEWHEQSSLLIGAAMLGFTSSKCSVLVTSWIANFQHLLHWTHFIKCHFVRVYLEVHYSESQGRRVLVDHIGPNEIKEVLIFMLDHWTIKIWDTKQENKSLILKKNTAIILNNHIWKVK